uniref:F-box domain-containing protein n=1 Tax=Anopheles atroparvus TaxID=41427 RepID=A0AAG5DRC9_ANOAO
MEPLFTAKCRSETELSTPNDERNQSALSELSASGRKRKLSTDFHTIEPNAKLQLLEQTHIDTEAHISTLSPNLCANLLDLSDEILLLILLQLDGNSLLSLSTTCTRLQILIADRTLWTVADYTTAKLGTQEIQQRTKLLKPITKTLKLRGMTSVYPAELWKVPTLTPAILETIYRRCPQMERLELTEAYFDTHEISIVMFPYSLRSLVLRKCALSAQNQTGNNHYLLPQPHPSSFLSNIYKHLARLEELTIEYCTWFDTHDFMVLSKLPNLRYLSLRGCANIKDSVPYASLATRFGFKKLEVLDLRDTPISDSDVSCFNIVHSLKELLLECPEHLRTEQGLQEYNEAERQRVEQLHRLAAPDRIQNNGAGHGHGVNQPAPREQVGAENAAVPPLVPPPRQGLFEIRVINGVQPGQANGGQPENYIRILRGPDDLLIQNMPYHPPAQADRRAVAPPSPPPPRVGAALAAAAEPPHVGPVPVGIEHNNNNVDRQHIVRIINRDMLLQRREPMDLENPQRFLARPQRIQLHAAYQHIFDAGGNFANRPRAPEPPQPDRAAVVAPELERPVEHAGINVHLRFHGIPNRAANNNQQMQQQQQDPQQQNNPAPQRVLPHVIIMPGIDNFQEIIHRQGNGNHHQLFVNLGMGQQAPNYVSLVSDRGICAYGVSRNELGAALMGGLLHQNLTGLERLSVRNYKLVTDTSLDHLESAAPYLKQLDVTGTSVTAEGVRSFRLSRPGCVVVSDYDRPNEDGAALEHGHQVYQ